MNATKKNLKLTCEFCDGGITKKLVQTRFKFKGQTIYVDDVPAWVCDRCGEKYFDAEVYKQLENIARRRKSISKTICFPLAKYSATSA
jgi:YgiT-type zinc finger domain-containing protein